MGALALMAAASSVPSAQSRAMSAMFLLVLGIKRFEVRTRSLLQVHPGRGRAIVTSAAIVTSRVLVSQRADGSRWALAHASRVWGGDGLRRGNDSVRAKKEHPIRASHCRHRRATGWRQHDGGLRDCLASGGVVVQETPDVNGLWCKVAT